ncbi:MAG: ribonuclease Y [Candidatus Omnitrophota bacterium]
MQAIIIVFAIIGGVVLFFAGYLLRRVISEGKIKSAEVKAKEILEEAKKETDREKKEAQIEAKNLLLEIRSNFEKETIARRGELQNLEKRLMQREENIDRKVELLERKERDIANRDRGSVEKEAEIQRKNKDLENLLQQEKEKLQRISGLSAEEAKKLLLSKMEGEIRYETGMLIKRIEEEARDTADKKAKDIISLAIQRCAADHTVESTVSVVNLPSDDMKGRIIGREGRNIRAFEMATGIDVIIDDTPEAVILSGFDIVRREIARITLERLLGDGRIHPARIEEVAAKVKEEMEVAIREEGEKAVFDIGLHSVHSEIIKLIGRLKYRTSYGQNVLQHSKETAFVMGVMAGELKLDSALARRIGLLHDIGKAVDHEVEGPHNKIGGDLAKKYGESQIVVDAIAGHHDEIDQKNIYAVLIQAADAVSATRPGARRETLESYIKRLEKLEALADTFKGVEKAYAIQAGREIRVIVQPDRISDAESANMSREIAKKIESEMEYPGQVKVTVIRETRSIEYAK